MQSYASRSSKRYNAANPYLIAEFGQRSIYERERTGTDGNEKFRGGQLCPVLLTFQHGVLMNRLSSESPQSDLSESQQFVSSSFVAYSKPSAVCALPFNVPATPAIFPFSATLTLTWKCLQLSPLDPPSATLSRPSASDWQKRARSHAWRCFL